MAKLIEEVLVLKFSRLLKDSDDTVEIVTEDFKSAIEEVAQELSGSAVLIEVEKA